MTKLKVIIGFSVYNEYYKQPKMKSKLDEKTGTYVIADYSYCSSNDEDENNPLYIEFKVGQILEVKEITVRHNLESYAYITFNNKIHKVPLEVLNFCTEKL